MRLVRPVWIRALIMPTRSLQVGRALKLSLDGATVDDAALTGPTKLPRCVWQRKIYSVGPSFTSSLNMLAEI
jgi:hypothetical protein